jgi:hemin uptake protein HemP
MSRVDTGGAPAPIGPKALNSAALLQGQVTVNIHHNGECYQLRTTRAGKLILTK